MAAPTYADVGDSVTVTGQLVLGDPTSQEPENLHVQRSDRDGTATMLADVVTAVDGTFAFDDTPTERGPSTYRVSFDGDATHAPDKQSVMVYVHIVGWDTDGDNRANLVVGAPGEDVTTVPDAGTFWLFNTTASGVTTSGARAYAQRTDTAVEFAESGDQLGAASASGDFNSDGYADIAIGVPMDDMHEGDPPVVDAGVVQVFSGSPTGVDLSRSRLVPELGLLPGAQTGTALAAGDFNDDGFADLAMGAPGFNDGSGGVDVMYGSLSGLKTPVRRSVLTQGALSTSNPGERFGAALASGDTNGDGIDDLAIGIPQNQQERTYPTGAVIVITGDQAVGLSTDNAHLWNLDSPGVPGSPAPFTTDTPDSFGDQLALGDTNGDGYDDLAISAPGAPVTTPAGPRQDAGTITILHGSRTGLTGTGAELLTQQTDGIQGTAETSDKFGTALATGDTNNDGTDDLAITTTGDHMVSLLIGTTGPLGSAPDHAWTQNTAGIPGADEPGDQFGASLRLTQLNNKPAASLTIGVPGENTGRGAFLTLYTNATTGITTTGAHTYTQNTTGIPGASEPGDHFGTLH